jgi:hypothetical protein
MSFLNRTPPDNGAKTVQNGPNIDLLRNYLRKKLIVSYSTKKRGDQSVEGLLIDIDGHEDISLYVNYRSMRLDFNGPKIKIERIADAEGNVLYENIPELQIRT